jgi:hypothetical protein
MSPGERRVGKRAKRTADEGMMQQLRKLPPPLRILAVVAVVLVVLALAAGVGAVAALLVVGPSSDSSGSEPERVGGAEHQQREAGPPGEDKPGQAGMQVGASDRPSEAEYLSEVGEIQNRAVEASLESNAKLLRYDLLTGDDLEEMEANRTALRTYTERVEALDPPEGYRDQYRVFVLAIDELSDANNLAYRLATDPASATQADFEAYDRHINRATSYLRRSNEALGRDYKTTEAAQKVSLG